jgi:hypothetical protein
MMIEVMLLLLAQSASPVLAVSDRIAAPPALAPQPPMERLTVRISSPEGVLWQGTLRVGPNQGASYQQNLSQASLELCPPGSPYDRSERRHINFNIYSQQDQQRGQSYRLDVSWGRPGPDEGCGERGTRTVQVNQAVVVEPGGTAVVEGDAGLRVELTRSR